MRVGITGAQGFIGSYLKRKIPKPEIFEGDLRDLEKVREFVKNCDRIYHLAGKNRGAPGEILKNNIISTGNLILAMKLENKYPSIIFSSTTQVEWSPDSEYGLTKYIEEEIVKKAKEWCIFRIPNVYGPGGKRFYNSVVATFTYQIANKLPVKIDHPETTREFIYIDEVVEKLITPKFGSCIRLGGETMSIKEIYEFLTSKLGDHKKLKKCLDYYKQK